jgi:excisionase family DNA binding protein
VSPDASERLTVAEAARRLGISQDAVRKRIKRRSIRYERGEGGRVYVYLDASETEQDTDRGRVQDHTAELIATLREQLEAERQAHAEARRLLLEALTKIPPAIEAPGSPETAAEETIEPTSSEPSREPTEPSSRPWWRRMFGG